MKLKSTVMSRSREGLLRGMGQLEEGSPRWNTAKEQFEGTSFLKNETDKWRTRLLILPLCFTTVCECFEV